MCPSRNQGESALDAPPLRGRRGGGTRGRGGVIYPPLESILMDMYVQHRIPLDNGGYWWFLLVIVGHYYIDNGF